MEAINSCGTFTWLRTAVTISAARTSQCTSREQHRAVHSVVMLRSVPYYRLKVGGCPKLFWLPNFDIITKVAAMFTM
jgi:hypothetical protein